ncbi:MAG: nicotinate-nicotinamide nucleotide adenylyltransferase, partial [Victivallaceae bacterium]
MRIGYFGGTFDPPHLAHFRIAQRVLELNLVDKVLFAPAFAPPHKNNERLSTFADRCEMVRLMCEGCKRMALSTVEAELHFYPSYTIRVLDALKKRYPADELTLLIGGDSLRTLHLW